MEQLFKNLSAEWAEIAERITCMPGDSGLKVVWEDGHAVIQASRRVEFFRGLGFVKQWIREGRESARVEEVPAFEHLTYMVDCSRNAVPSTKQLEEMLFALALLGYDRLMLYTEDTYEIEGRPFFGWMRGRYSREELRSLDVYAQSLGIELVPCIQTLAHLNAIFRWPAFQSVYDTADILNCGEEETYALIEDMIRTWSETVSSRVVNIGMDEAEMIGRGRFLERFGYQERFEIMQKHLKRVLAICEKYGFRCMMWSDMFFKLISGGGYLSDHVNITDEIRAKIPQNVELIYWDYYSRDPEKYDSMLLNHKKLSGSIGFAGGAWKWTGYAPLIRHSMLASQMALEACRSHGISDIIVTGWGDDGGDASQNCVWPVLTLYAESCYENRTDEDWLEGRMYACTGGWLKDFLMLDLPNLTPDNPSPGRVGVGPAKYLLYQDAMMGLYDRHVDEETYPKHFAECAAVFDKLAARGGKYAYLFETQRALCSVLAYKCDLGIRIRNAYLAEDRAALKELALRSKKAAELVLEFRGCLYRQWLAENKIFGWEVQDIRLSGAAGRLSSAAERIGAYLEGEIDRLEELEEERLLLDDGENPGYRTLPHWECFWKKIVTASVI